MKGMTRSPRGGCRGLLSGVCLLFLLWVIPAHSQLLLNAGDSWTYQFNTLPFTGLVSSFTTNTGGSLTIVVNGSSFPPGSSMTYSMYENSPSEAPIFSATMNGAPPYTVSGSQNGAWQDIQGAIRLTMNSGSARIDTITLQAIVAGPSLSSYNVYSTSFTPVPEPATWTLVALGFGAAIVWRRRKR